MQKVETKPLKIPLAPGADVAKVFGALGQQQFGKRVPTKPMSMEYVETIRAAATKRHLFAEVKNFKLASESLAYVEISKGGMTDPFGYLSVVSSILAFAEQIRKSRIGVNGYQKGEETLQIIKILNDHLIIGPLLGKPILPIEFAGTIVDMQPGSNPCSTSNGVSSYSHVELRYINTVPPEYVQKHLNARSSAQLVYPSVPIEDLARWIQQST
jgi:hypothetical protein